MILRKKFKILKKPLSFSTFCVCVGLFRIPFSFIHHFALFLAASRSSCVYNAPLTRKKPFARRQRV